MKIIEYSFVIWRKNFDVEMNMANNTETTAPGGGGEHARRTHTYTKLMMIRFAGNTQKGNAAR